MNNNHLQGKTAIITGAGYATLSDGRCGSIGYGIATAFAKEGANLVITGRQVPKLEKAKAELERLYGVKVLAIPADISAGADNAATAKAVVDAAVAEFGRIDVLVNNAGGGVSIVDTVEQTCEDIDTAIALNLNSVIYGCKLFGEMMKARGDGIVINLASVCARHCWGGWSVYAAAKAGVLNFTKGFYVEMQPFGVRATCVIPASSATGFQSNAGIDNVTQTLSAEDIANAICYAANQPKGVVVEEMTVWGTSQQVQPL